MEEKKLTEDYYNDGPYIDYDKFYEYMIQQLFPEQYHNGFGMYWKTFLTDEKFGYIFEKYPPISYPIESGDDMSDYTIIIKRISLDEYRDLKLKELGI
jgi:hypothetical protein